MLIPRISGVSVDGSLNFDAAREAEHDVGSNKLLQ